MFGNIDQNALVAYYRDADVALVTPLRDGMNLVCKEFVVSVCLNIALPKVAISRLKELTFLALFSGSPRRREPWGPDSVPLRGRRRPHARSPDGKPIRNSECRNCCQQVRTSGGLSSIADVTTQTKISLY